MQTYFVATQICSNVPVQNLRYDLSIYRTYVDENKLKHKYELLPQVTNQQFLADYKTMQHEVTTNDALTTIYMVEISIYQKNSKYSEAYTHMYTLEELTQGKTFSANKKENACYFVTTLTTTADINYISPKIEISAPSRVFIAREYPIGHVDDPFAKDKIESELIVRLNNHLDDMQIWLKLEAYTGRVDYMIHASHIEYSQRLGWAKDHVNKYSKYPRQGKASLCGPATFFYCLLRDRPDIYAQAARELWQHGKTKIGNLTIKPKEDCKHPAKDFYSGSYKLISGLDWITLASLRDSENIFFDYDQVNYKTSGITFFGFPGWFEQVGYQKILDNAGTFRSIVGKKLNKQDIVQINNYYQQGYTVILLVASVMLEDEGKSSTKNHWIVLESAVVDAATQEPITNNTPDNTYIDLTVFSWGKVQSWYNWQDAEKQTNKTLGYFMKNAFGFLVFKRIV